MEEKPVMSETDSKPAGYALTGIEKAPGRNEFYLTVSRDGRAVGRVKVRAPSSAPTFYDEPEAPIRPQEPAETAPRRAERVG